MPSGVVTLLFSDIEDSTGLDHRLGDDYLGVLEGYRGTVRNAVAECVG